MVELYLDVAQTAEFSKRVAAIANNDDLFSDG